MDLNMANAKDEPTRITLEELLRLKRAERPPAEFWDQFEREFQQKAMQALVESESRESPFWSGVGARVLAAAPIAALFVAAASYLIWQPAFLSDGGEAATADAALVLEMNLSPVHPDSEIVVPEIPFEDVLAQAALSQRRTFVYDVLDEPGADPDRFDRVMASRTFQPVHAPHTIYVTEGVALTDSDAAATTYY